MISDCSSVARAIYKTRGTSFDGCAVATLWFGLKKNLNASNPSININININIKINIIEHPPKQGGEIVKTLTGRWEHRLQGHMRSNFS